MRWGQLARCACSFLRGTHFAAASSSLQSCTRTAVCIVEGTGGGGICAAARCRREPYSAQFLGPRACPRVN
eukprot:8994300-Lingulodinium_polyedra.AAC.1